MPRVLVLEPRRALADRIAARLSVERDIFVDVGGTVSAEGQANRYRHIDEFDTLVYSPPRHAKGLSPDLCVAKAFFESLTHSTIDHLILISDAAVYGADHSNPGFMRESRPVARKRADRVADQWRILETSAHGTLPSRCMLTTLRPSFTLIGESGDFASRLFRKSITPFPAGYDPCIQLLSCDDLASAVCCAVMTRKEGIYNVAPDGAMPLLKAFRQAGMWTIPLPPLTQRSVRRASALLGFDTPLDWLGCMRYPMTLSNERSKQELGFRPTKTTAEALDEYRSSGQPNPKSVYRSYDRFGLDRDYMQWYMRTVLWMAERGYWRIETDGLQHVPRQGGAVLVGVHRGFMPFDGVMLAHLLAKYTGRFPRFLAHPALMKTPFIGRFLNKLGAIIACQENADFVLQNDEIVGIFPEGIRGVFRMYRGAYSLGKFGRNEFVSMAARHGVPIVPVALVGTVEIFPILARIDWPWWKQNTEWPFFPITPTWPLVPLPLPSKWHVQVLPAIRVPRVASASKAAARQLISEVSRQVRHQLQQSIDQMRDRRPSAFYGSVFDNSDTLRQESVKGETT